ncbi:MAG: hypothetical protein AABX01_05160 [Candidatus Micrarchaeota archaeon]
MYEMVEKEVDKQNRLLLPREWVRELFGKSRKAFIIKTKDSVKIIPRSTHKLSDFFDEAKVDHELDPFKDYHGALAKASLRVKW